MKFYSGQWFEHQENKKEYLLVKYMPQEDTLYLYEPELKQYFKCKKYLVGHTLHLSDKPADIGAVLELDIGLKGDKQKEPLYNKMDAVYYQSGMERSTMLGSYGKGLRRGR